MNVGDTLEYNYTGGMQSFSVSDKGLYKLEVWGAQGGGNNGGLGGYSYGYAVLEPGQIVYVCVGQRGNTSSGSGTSSAKAYNGGAGATAQAFDGSDVVRGGGGGATHMSFVTGTLKDIGFTSFVTNQNGLIVAGGGGGCKYNPGYSNGYGGTGGGINGGNGNDGGTIQGTGGTQSSGGTGQGGAYNGTFGSSSESTNYTGGGGGFYGGGSHSGASGGGSGWIDGVPELSYKGHTYTPSTTNGVRQGNGRALITYVAKASAPIYLGNTPIDAIYLGENPVDNIYLGNTPL